MGDLVTDLQEAIGRPGVLFQALEGTRRICPWARFAGSLVRRIGDLLAVLSVCVLVIWAIRVALIREEVILDAQAQERQRCISPPQKVIGYGDPPNRPPTTDFR